MTADPAIGEDAAAFFRNMLVNKLDGEYKQLCVSPFGIKSMLLENIDRQIALGENGYVCIKANSVTEREVIDKLAEASRAGVEVQLIIRGICCILPGVAGETENIHVTSVVGRFLEHGRIYQFGRGGDAEVYIFSADLMTRNLNRRVEIACPVCDTQLREQLEWILVFRRLSFLLVLLALLAGVCSMLWPHSFADLQPECDSITLIRTDTAEDYSLTQTREIYSADSPEFAQIMDILSRYTYHRSFRTLTKANNMEGNHAGFWLHVYLDHGDDRVNFTCGGTGEILIDGLVWRVGYWGDRASLPMMAELAAVLEKQENPE